MLGSADGDDIVIADLEAGMGTLTRLGEERPVDLVLVVVEPTAKAIETGRRIADLVSTHGLGETLVIANRSGSEADLERVRKAFPRHRVVAVPDDPAVSAADRVGMAPLDRVPDSPAVMALAALAHELAPAV